MNGYVGEESDSNSLCVSPSYLLESSNIQNKLRMINQPVVENSECNLDCGLWSHCEIGANGEKICVRDSKQCTNPHCSGNGICIFRAWDYTRIYSCSVGSTSCYATCVCNKNFGGTDCSYPINEFQHRLTLRFAALTSVSQSLLNEDINAETVISWINTLSSLCQQSSEGNIDVFKNINSFN